MPKVEETLASYLSPESSSSIKSPILPNKPVRITSALVGKAYSAAGQVAAFLHTMSLLQAYQAELLTNLDEGEGISPNTICELRRATYLSLRTANETSKSIGRSMAALVATEIHLWLNLSNIKGKDKNFLMNAPISPSGLFGDAVNLALEIFQESAKQAAVFQKLLPRCIHISGAAEREQPQTSKSSSPHRATQKQSVAYRAPPHEDWGQGKHTQPQPSKCKTDLRTIINAKKSAGKRSWCPRAQASEDFPPEVEWSTPCLSPSGVLRGPFCQPCHLVCFRVQRFPASAYLKVYPET